MSGVEIAVATPCSPMEVLHSVWPYSPARVDHAATARCEALAQSLPFEACSVYIEGRFGADHRVDYLVATKTECAAVAFRTMELDSHVTWRRSAEFLRQLSTSRELGSVPFIWFEYDGDRSGVDGTVPSVSVGLEPDYLLRHRRDVVGSDSRSIRIAKAALHSLLPERNTAIEAGLESCFEFLPPNGAILYLSVMHGRKPAAVKLFVALPRAALESYLDCIRWRGHRTRLKQLLETYYAPFLTTAYVDLTLAESGVAERIGLATSQFHRLEVELDDPELGWLRLPPEHDATKRELRAWPGAHCVNRGNRRSLVRRWLDTKAVLDGTQLEYKFYLGYMTQPGYSLPSTHE